MDEFLLEDLLIKQIDQQCKIEKLQDKITKLKNTFKKKQEKFQSFLKSTNNLINLFEIVIDRKLFLIRKFY